MWGQLLVAVTAPVVTRVLATLGIGIVSYTGFTALLAQANTQIQNSFNGLPADISGLLFLSGVPQAMALILSALAARVAMSQLSKIQRL